MKTMLAIDTSFGTFSIAVYRGDEQLAYFENEEYSKQAEMLVPEIENLLAKCELSYADLQQIAVCVGPGSFTGLRIGIAAAKGLALALEVELIGISSLQTAAMAQNGGIARLDAKRGEAYLQEFDADLQPVSQPELIEYDGQDFSPLPNADLVAQAALKSIGSDKVSPLYIRKPDAKLPA